MPKRKPVKVIKVPLPSHERSADMPLAFPRLPRLYLELLENKDKIKQDLINTEYNPSTSTAYAPPSGRFERQPSHREAFRPGTPSIEIVDSDDEGGMRDEISLLGDDEMDDGSFGRPDSISPIAAGDAPPENPLASRLKELLKDSDDEGDKYSRNYEDATQRSSKHRSASYAAVKEISAAKQVPPSLAELEAAGKYQRSQHLRDINTRPSMSEQQVEDKKREYLFKYDLLANVPNRDHSHLFYPFGAVSHGDQL